MRLAVHHLAPRIVHHGQFGRHFWVSLGFWRGKRSLRFIGRGVKRVFLPWQTPKSWKSSLSRRYITPGPDRRAGRGRTMRMDPLFFRDSESEDNRGDQLSPGCPRVGSSRYLVGGVQDRVDDTRESTTVLVEQSQNSELNQGPQLGNADQVDFQVDGMDSGGKSPPCGSQDFLPRSSASLSEGLTLPYPHSLTCLPRSPSASLSSASLAAVSSPSRSPESSYLALNLRSNWGFN